MENMKKLIFRLRWRLMPSEFKQGTWLLTSGEALNISEFWKETKTKGYWELPHIVCDKEGKLLFSQEWRDL
jgi:hypothetical protein